MATLLDAVRGRHLEIFEVPEWDNRMPVRQLYVAPALWDWIDNEPRAHVATADRGGRSPFEHMDQMFSDYRCDPRALRHGDLKRMQPTSNGIWRIHPPGLRVFGWVAVQQAFVAVRAVMEADLKDGTLSYDDQRAAVLDFARVHDLEHTIIRGDYLAVFAPNH